MRYHATRNITLALALLLTAGAFTCTVGTFERTTYNSLAVSKAAIDSASQQYNSGAIPRTKAAYDLLQKAQTAQNAAVDAFKTYLYIKAGGTTTDLTTAQTNVTAATASLAAAVADIQSLLKGAKSGNTTPNANPQH